MKKQKSNNRSLISKITARVIAFALLITLSIFLTSCPGYGHREVTLTFYSYDEMLEYAIDHKQEFESDNCIFLMFDVDKYDNISTEYYSASTMWYDGLSEFLNLPQNDKLSKDHWSFSVKCYLKMNSVLDNGEIVEDAYKIECSYAGVLDADESAATDNLGIKGRSINLVDLSDTDSYLSTYSAFVGNNSIEIYIKHKHYATQDELDAICMFLLNNAVIIGEEE